MITYCWNEQCLSWRHGHQTTGQNNLSCSHTAETNNDSLGDTVVRQENKTTCHDHILLKQMTWSFDKRTEQPVMFTYCWNKWHGHQTRAQNNLSCSHTAETNNDSLGDMVIRQENKTTCHDHILLKQWLSWGHGHQTRGQNNLSCSHTAETNNDSLGDTVIRQEDRTTCHVHTAIVCQLLHTMWQWLSGWRWSHQTNGQGITICHVHTATVCWLFHSVTYWAQMKSSDRYNNLSCSHSNCVLTLSLSDLLGADEVIRQI